MALPVTQSQAANGVPLARRPVTLGVIVGNRGFFPNHLAITGRKVMLDVLAEAGIKTIIVGEDETSCGAITSMREVQICVDLFRQHRDDIDGILITLPNFGEETAMADVLKRANLNVPVLIHA